MNRVNHNPDKFGRLLKTAVRKIALQENKNIAVIQDELGYALGRETGGAAIQFWERGNIPAKRQDVEQLRQELARLNGLSQEEATLFAAYAGYPESAAEQDQPFVAGPPITQPRYFFGRNYELKRLFDLWKHAGVPAQNAAIIGPRGSGKTSLLLYLAQITTTPASQLRTDQRTNWLSRPETYRWIFVDFRSPQLGTRTGLLSYILSSLGLVVPSPCNLDRFVDVMAENLTRRTIILLDEIGVALNRWSELDDTFWDGLRALACTHARGNLAFVLSARELPGKLARRNNRSSDFFSIFAYTATLGPLPATEAQALIATSPWPFPEEDVDWILAQSQCWPLLVQILCRERLITLAEGDSGPAWREEGLRQLVPFEHLRSD
jgi:hypothetical protein